MTKADKTRQFIIEKSAPVFNVKGVAGTAMSDIMEVTNMAKGTLYIHFENKEALARSVVDYNLKAVVDRAVLAADSKTTYKDKLLAFIMATFSPQKITLAGGCPMINFGMEADDTNPAIRKKVNKAAESIQQHIRSLVESGIAAGEFRKGWDATLFGVKAFALIEGGIVLARISGNNEKMKTIIRIIESEIEEHTI